MRLKHFGRISIGNYNVLLVLVQPLLCSLVSLSEIFDQYQRAMASVNRVIDLFDTLIQINTGDTHLDLDSSRC